MSPKLIRSVPLKSIFKEYGELLYWKIRKTQEKSLFNGHFEFHFTEAFNLSLSDYSDKKILDIGCGPRGSLEWADMASERIGLDPLVKNYQSIGTKTHKMKYVEGYSEEMPFENNYFDFISSFNNLDHVNDLEKTCQEITRVLKPGGLFLLLVEIHKTPLVTEPQALKWSLIQDYFKSYEILEESHYETVVKNRMYSNSTWAKPVTDYKKQNGVLKAKLQKQ